MTSVISSWKKSHHIVIALSQHSDYMRKFCVLYSTTYKKKKKKKKKRKICLKACDRLDNLNVFFFLTFFFCFCFYFVLFFKQQTFQIWVGHNFVQYEKWNLIFGRTRYKTEHRVEVCCLIVSVMSFHLYLAYFDKQVYKKLKKKLSKQKKLKAWILLNQTRNEKQTQAAALRHTIYFF